MVITRSQKGDKTRDDDTSAGTGATETSGTSSNTASRTTNNTITSATTGTTSGTEATVEKAGAVNPTETPAAAAIADTTGTASVTDHASVSTLVPGKHQMLPPPPPPKSLPKPARSRRSGSSRKRLLAELEAKERLAELELKQMEAAAALERARLERLQAESVSSGEESDADLTSQRVNDWFERQPEQQPQLPGPSATKTHQQELAREIPIEHQGERRGQEARAIMYEQREPEAPPARQPPPIDVTSLATALTEAVRATQRTAPRFLQELPTFSGHSNEWLSFRAAYYETEESFTTSENVARLRRSLKGPALEAVSALLISQPAPRIIITSLERRFGRPDAILMNEMEKLKSLHRLTDNPRDLNMFANRVANTIATIEILKKPEYLHNPEILRQIIEKLTPILRNKWYDYASNKMNIPELKKIADFLNEEADKCAAYAPIEQSVSENKAPRKKIERTYAASADTKPGCPNCKENHRLPDCPQFLSADTSKRWEITKKCHICFRCLLSKHRRLSCRAKPCGHNGCPMRHHRLLHHEKIPENSTEQPPVAAQAPPRQVLASAVEHTTAAADTYRRRAYLKIAPVVLRGPLATIQTYALLDEGSTISIIDSSIAEILGLQGPTEPIWVQGVSGTEIVHEESKRVDVAIKGKHTERELLLSNVRTVGRLEFTTQSVRAEDIEDCVHLQDIKQELIYEGATPKILIGQDNWDIIVSRSIRDGRRDQLVASQTLLGWVLHGCRTSQTAPVAFCSHISMVERAESIEESMKKFFTLESLGIEPRTQRSDPNEQALKLLEERSHRLPDGRFETGLLWREDNIKIPNNRPDALRRLHTLEKKLDRNPDLKTKYKERVENLLKSNYAEKVTAPSDHKTWYLPHFAVVSPEKSKIRLVHDAAAKSHGVSLNDLLLPGPDLLQSLPGVVMRFRQQAVAVSADIKEMFMQIKIREEDRDALRFLWRGDRREGEPEEYRMTSVIFGASSSPCTALYIKNRNASDFEDKYPDAARAIKRNHYMDDYLQSFPTSEEAIETSKTVDYIHKQAGFELRGWATNNEEIARTYIASSTSTTVAIGGSHIEKALGLQWNTEEDCISFRLNKAKATPELLDDLRPPTKREALSIIMSIFDPLGLISPVTTPAKRILQDTWRFKTDWDEPIPEELQERWSDWLQQLRALEQIRIPRCYDYEPAATYELHTFVDSSEEAYAAAVYWRTKHADGSVRVALAAAKSRVTPTKPISIPRLELQAAVLGVRLARTVAEEHDFEIAGKTYWSDSRTALAWIRGEPRAYKTFVAHRLAEIEDSSKKNEWKWVPSEKNVADDATRATPSDFDMNHRWYNGPEFLYQPEDSWPTERKVEVIETGEEKEKCCATQERGHAHLPAIERFSKWTRLIRVTARVLQFIDLCRTRKDTVAAARRKRTLKNPTEDCDWKKPAPRRQKLKLAVAPKSSERTRSYVGLQAYYLLAAERLWIRASQEECYAKERERISRREKPDSSDRLAALSTYIDSNGIIRLRGRISAADALHEETASPAVLHGKHMYTRLYIQHVHEKLHHGGTEITVNELRQRMYIMKIRPAVKNTIKNCPTCRLKKAKPASPTTGDLPAARLAHHVRPFSYTGLDYFGPLEVTVGRHREKRYVALFTCMTSRAVHLEVAASLSTDSAICALRRFISRRGCPTELWSDNATCFRSADRELTQSALQAMEEEAINRHIIWRFLPPAAPFMAGAWERMVRTVKEALRTTLQEKYPSDETLTTLLAEVEMTVNSRPLTHVAVSPEDPPALTPNMILIGPNCHVPAPGTFEETDLTARQHWKRAQRLADIFWERWVKEYMPLLQHRREPHSSGVSPVVGDIVIICDSNLPRNTWPRGRVTKVFPGKDGEVRVVDVTTSNGHTLRRPTKKIVVLPTSGIAE